MMPFIDLLKIFLVSFLIAGNGFAAWECWKAYLDRQQWLDNEEWKRRRRAEWEIEPWPKIDADSDEPDMARNGV